MSNGQSKTRENFDIFRPIYEHCSPVCHTPGILGCAASLIRIRRLKQDLIAVYKSQLLLRYLLDILLGLHVYAVFLKLFGTFFFFRNLCLQIFLTN